jgi:glycerophosphoryl diester phosphodiesterase
MKRKTEEKDVAVSQSFSPPWCRYAGTGKTMAAMRYGWEHGFAAVEFDVMLSKDQRPVVIHDEEFGRTVAGSGKVSGHDADFIMQQDAGAWFSADYKESLCRTTHLW